MKIRECIDEFDRLNPNQYEEETKVKWLSNLDQRIFYDIFMTHELTEEEMNTTTLLVFQPYSSNNMMKELLVPAPYDELYNAYLQMKVDEADKETSRYNNSLTLYNAYYEGFEGYWNRTHRSKPVGQFNAWRH